MFSLACPHLRLYGIPRIELCAELLKNTVWQHFLIYIQRRLCYYPHSNRRAGNKKNRFMRIRGLTLREAGLVGLYISVAIILSLPGRVHAQAKGTVSQNPVNPLGVPIRITNYPRPVRSVVTGAPSARQKNAIAPTPTPCPTPTSPWCFTLSGSYQFSSQRSRVGDVSLNSDSGVVDLTAIRKF